MLGRWYGDFTVRRLRVATGALLAKLGRSGREGSGRQPFELAEVTDVAWGFGALFISDGGDGDALNERVARLDGATYEPVWIRGNNGTVDPSDDPVGNFSQLHSVTIDESRNRVWLADRAHNRLVALDASTGAFVGAWPCVAEVNGAGPNAVRYGGGASDAQICSVSQKTQPSSATQLAQVRCAAQGSQSQTSQSQYSGASQYPSAR